MAGLPLQLNGQMMETMQHGDVSFPIGYYVDEMWENDYVSLHWHPSFEFYYVIQGCVEVRIESNSVILHPGEGVFLNTGILHSFQQIPKFGHCLCPNMVFSPGFLFPPNTIMAQKYYEDFLIGEKISHIKLSPAVSWQRSALQHLEKIFARLQVLQAVSGYGKNTRIKYPDYVWEPDEPCRERGFQSKSLEPDCEERDDMKNRSELDCEERDCRINRPELARDDLELEIQIELLLVWKNMIRHPDDFARSDRYRKTNPGHLRLQIMLLFIQEHYSEPITLEEIAESANVSRSEAGRCFQQYAACSPIDYLIRFRIGCAKQMLIESNEPVSIISERCGFSSPGYFDKTFKKIAGCTPAFFRKQQHSIDLT